MKRRCEEDLHNKEEKYVNHGFLAEVKAYIVPAGIGKARCGLFQRQLVNNGGEACAKFTQDHVTHVIIDEKIDIERLCRVMEWDHPPDPAKCKIVKSLWLSHCLRDKFLIDSSSYELDICKSTKKSNTGVKQENGQVIFVPSDGELDAETDNQPSTSFTNSDEKFKRSINLHHQKVSNLEFSNQVYKKVNDDDNTDVDSDYVPSGDEDDGTTSHGENEQLSTLADGMPLPRGNWVCARSSMAPTINHNKHITDKLQALAKTYENTNDKWRALGYSKAISILKSYPKEIKTFEEALALPGVGKHLAEKIWEIIERGELRKLNELSSSEEIKAINLFTNIWGVGATTARLWVAQNLRTLDDVHEKANLTRVQKIGLKYYDELLDRMQRSEAAEIEKVVIEATKTLDPELICMACGSFRRGKPTCGDVDILITHPDSKSHKGVFSKLLTMLRQSGFLTDDLVTQEDNGHQKKYLGVCRLPGKDRFHRRLDIIVVPYDEFACASMYFTGSAHFNRSMRNLASKMGMSLNEHGLFAGIIRQNHEKITKGYPLKTPDEASIFKHLGLTYRPPSERDH